MRTKTNVKAGGTQINHNEASRNGLMLKTHVKAGGYSLNRNESLARGDSMKKVIPTSTNKDVKRLRLCVVRTGLRAGQRAHP